MTTEAGQQRDNAIPLTNATIALLDGASQYHAGRRKRVLDRLGPDQFTGTTQANKRTMTYADWAQAQVLFF